jgi:hypothetical protein
MTLRSERPIPDIFRDLVTQLTGLFRTEAQLARAELSEKMAQLAGALALIVAGAVLLMPALVILLNAAVAGLMQAGLAPYWSALAIGGGALLIGLVLVAIGAGRLRAERLVPGKSIEQIQRDASVAKHQMRRDHDQKRAA